MEQGIGKKILGVLAGAAVMQFFSILLPNLSCVWYFVGVMVCLEILSINNLKQGALYGSITHFVSFIFFAIRMFMSGVYSIGEMPPSMVMEAYSIEEMPPLNLIIPVLLLISLLFSGIGAILGLIGVTLRNAIRKR